MIRARREEKPQEWVGVLYDLVRDILDDSEAYDYARCVWLGGANVSERLSGAASVAGP